MKRVLFVIGLLLSLGVFCACSDDDSWDNIDEYQSNQEALCNTWQLIGYGSESKFHKIAEEYRKKSETYGSRFYLIFNSNGTLTGRDAVNQIYGNYTCNGSIIIIGEVIGTEIYDKEKDSREFLWRLQDAKSYLIKDGKKLRLYYSDNEFLYFELMK